MQTKISYILYDLSSLKITFLKLVYLILSRISKTVETLVL